MRSHASLLLSLLLPLLAGTSLRADEPAPARFESEIAAFEKKDREQPPAKGGILFIGSSSIRKWTTLATDFPDLPVLNRGFGGSVISESIDYLDRIVFPYQPRLIVMYAGGNDIHYKKSPEQVLADFRTFATKVHERLPGTRLDYISISPNPARWAEVETVKIVNAGIEQFCRDSSSYLTFIDLFPFMLGDDGLPRPDIFVADKLHMNAAGYALWKEKIRPFLDAAPSH